VTKHAKRRKLELSRWVSHTATVLFALCWPLALGCSRTVEAKPKKPEGKVVASYAGDALTISDVDALVGDEIYRARSRALISSLRQKLIAARAKKQGIDAAAWRKREIEDKVPQLSDSEIERIFQEALAAGKIPPTSVLDDATRERIRESNHRAAFQARMDRVTEQLFAEAKVKIDWDALGQPRVDVRPRGASRGPDNAPVTIIEFADFECKFCALATATVRQVSRKYPTKVRFVFRHNPLPEHAHAQKAAEAALCAGEQGRFWEYHDLLFEHSNALSIDDLKRYANLVGIDASRFSACLDSSRQASEVKADVEAAHKANLDSTPTFIVNGVVVPGAVSAEDLGRYVDRELMTLTQ